MGVHLPSGPRVPGPLDGIVLAVLASVIGVAYLADRGWFSGPQPGGYLVVLVLAACLVAAVVARREGRAR